VRPLEHALDDIFGNGFFIKQHPEYTMLEQFFQNVIENKRMGGA
jgi:hypothetical protein